ncbi:Dolichyl-diphosphooligosaccharide-protein glycosyltransferase subunit dad1 [Gnomoniopsis sp. IMI 355080]|nr:Dolichyl-diphosphooligosaccharide-protein glycosyltransferase subunit dad1 [Gnomoniopsis sp. IMI 355080]
MASTSASARGEFERQRGELIKEIAESFEHVLANINKLNRNLEAVITVGNEFSSVEALWSTFENVMGKEEEGEGTGKQDGTNADEAEGEAQEELEQEEDVKAET